MMTSRKKAAIAGFALGLILGVAGTTWVMMEMRSRQVPIEVDYIEEI